MNIRSVLAACRYETVRLVKSTMLLILYSLLQARHIFSVQRAVACGFIFLSLVITRRLRRRWRNRNGVPRQGRRSISSENIRYRKLITRLRTDRPCVASARLLGRAGQSAHGAMAQRRDVIDGIHNAVDQRGEFLEGQALLVEI
jgi:hypothetical protein